MGLLDRQDLQEEKKRAAAIARGFDATRHVTASPNEIHGIVQLDGYTHKDPDRTTAKESRLVKNVVQKLTPGRDVHALSDGAWGAHSMLAAILRHKIRPPVDLWITTWVISQEPADWLIDRINNGVIRSIKGLVDHRNRQLRAGIVAQLNGHDAIQLYHTNLHAKVFAVVPATGSPVVCLSSANFTRNKRIEFFVLTMDHNVVEFHTKWIREKWQHENALAKNQKRKYTRRPGSADDSGAGT